MSFMLDSEVADALAPPVGDVATRRAFWEPVIGAAGTAQPMPAEVTMTDHHATAADGAQRAPGNRSCVVVTDSSPADRR